MLVNLDNIINKGEFVKKPKLTFLWKELQRAISNARSIYANYGSFSKRAIAAWDFVDELEAEAGFYGASKLEKSARGLFSDCEDLVAIA